MNWMGSETACRLVPCFWHNFAFTVILLPPATGEGIRGELQVDPLPREGGGDAERPSSFLQGWRRGGGKKGVEGIPSFCSLEGEGAVSVCTWGVGSRGESSKKNHAPPPPPFFWGGGGGSKPA